MLVQAIRDSQGSFVRSLLPSMSSPLDADAVAVTKAPSPLPQTSAEVVMQTPSQPLGDLAHEIEVTSDWGNVLEEDYVCKQPKQIKDLEVWLAANLLSENECCSLLKKAEEHGFGATDYPKSYRGNLRLITTDNSLTEAMWHRLQPLVPPTLSLDGHLWDACGLNECWRLAKYYPGDRFGTHCDACFDRSADEMSMLTVNIYMNGGFDGGSTRFYDGRDDPTPAFSVKPRTGLCLLFRQPPGKNYYHDGEELRSDVKYLFRSDVMYRKRQGDAAERRVAKKKSK